MAVLTNVLNFMMGNDQFAPDSGVIGYSICLTYDTPDSIVYVGSVPSNILTDIVSATLGSPSGGIRTLSSDVVLTANQAETANYAGLYKAALIEGEPAVYILTAIAKLETPIELAYIPPTKVTVKSTSTTFYVTNKV